jgi:exonuclease V
LDALNRLGKSSIRATDIAAQYWCERQMELNYIHGPKITNEIKKGRAMHEGMENEVNVPIVLMPKSYPDFMYKSLYTSAMALDSLFKNGKAREIQVYGSINGFKLAGKIDLLELHDDEVTIVEDKTKANDNMPSEPQLLTHKVQVMLYKRVMENLRQKKYSLEDFRKAYKPTFMRITPEFTRQLEALSISKDMQSVDAVAVNLFEEFAKVKRISDNLRIRYINQYTGKEIGVHRFVYKDEELSNMMEFALKYWKGERESLPVPEQEKWKCNYCAFFGKECKVWWPQQNL